MRLIKSILKKLMNLIPLSNKVILESNPDLSDNTYSLFCRMIERGYNEKYRFYWMVQDPSEFRNVKIKNVFIKQWKPRGILGKLDRLWLLYTAKFIIVCNKYIEKRREKQVVAALGHGTVLKSVKQHKIIGPDCDFTLCPSEFFTDIYCDQLWLKEEQLLISGYPRNDLLFQNKAKLSDILSGRDFEKSIIWMPTFRQQKNSNRVDCDYNFALGIPIIYDTKALKEINEYLAERNIVLILKLHPAQDIAFIKAASLSHLIVLTDDMLEKNGVKLYEILSDTDALITDYSSIYYDYLLLHKPIGITLDDFKEYSEQNGFAFDNVLDILAGEHIFGLEDLKRFISNLHQNIDNFASQRDEVNRKVNKFSNGGYSDYVLDYLIKEKNF